MNDEGRRHSAPANSNTTGLDHTPAARPRPELVIRVPFDSWALISRETASLEDEQRLALWLSSAAARRHVLQAVADALDQFDRGRAA